MRDFTDDLRDLRRRLSEAHGYLRVDELKARVAELEIEVSRPTCGTTRIGPRS